MEMQLQVGVKILLKNKEGKYLLLFKSLGNEPKPHHSEYWDIPGGRINLGSSLLENLAREVMEETGLTLEGEIKLLTAQDILKQDKHVVRLTYTGSAVGEVRLSEEHSKYNWFSVEEIKNLEHLDSYLKEVLDKFLN